ncbi:MAG: hypothetical protein QOF27_2859 [Gaiellaceae bacterium]|nr:hypothetical protein [Gaiellaceae bacterium]
MRLFPPVALAVAFVAIAAAGVPASGESSPVQQNGLQAANCGLADYGTGPEVVFGRTKTQAEAETLRGRVVGQGFVSAAIEADCTNYRVVVRGYDTFDIAVELQAEANEKSTFRPTVECYSAPDKGGELEVAMGHARDLPSAKALVSLVASRGFPNAALESDPCGGYEVMMKGFSSTAQANAFAAEATSVGFTAHLEPDS